MALKAEKSKESAILCYSLLAISALLIAFYIFMPVESLLKIANGHAEDSTCNICSTNAFSTIKYLILTGGILLAIASIAIRKYAAFFERIFSSKIFGFKLFIFLFLIALFLYFDNLGAHSIWLDEAWVANSVLQPNIKDMIFLRGSGIDSVPQANAPLFLMSVRFMVGIFDNGEAAFRLISALMATLSFILIYLLCKKLIHSESTALIATSLFGFNAVIVRYSQELKPYMGDIFFAILLFYLAEWYIEHKHELKYLLGLICTSVIAIFFSQPSIFIIAAVIARVLFAIYKENRNIHGIIHAQKEKILSLGIYAMMVFISYLCYFFFILRYNITNAAWTKDWIPYFISTDSITGVLSFLIYQSYSFFPYLFIFVPFFMFLLFVIGIVAVIRQKNYPPLIYFLAPIILTILASAMQKYPYGGIRTGLFLTPLAFIFISCGIKSSISLFKRYTKITAIVMLAIIVMIPITSMAQHILMPRKLEEMRPVVEFYKQHALKTDYTYIHWYALQPYKFYYGTFEGENIIHGSTPFNITTDIYDINQAINKIAPNRLWLIVSHLQEKRKVLLIEAIQARCKLLNYYEDVRASAHLFEC